MQYLVCVLSSLLRAVHAPPPHPPHPTPSCPPWHECWHAHTPTCVPQKKKKENKKKGKERPHLFATQVHFEAKELDMGSYKVRASVLTMGWGKANEAHTADKAALGRSPPPQPRAQHPVPPRPDSLQAQHSHPPPP